MPSKVGSTPSGRRCNLTGSARRMCGRRRFLISTARTSAPHWLKTPVGPSAAEGTFMLLPTTIVGSYPQPEWLIDRAKLAGRLPPRVRARELWRIAPEFLQEAQDDATIMAIKAQEDAGIDIITDGEMRRESYSNRFATALDGVDIDNPAIITARNGQQTPVPRVVGKIGRS